MFIGFWLMTWAYVRRANGEFDALTQEIVREATRGGQEMSKHLKTLGALALALGATAVLASPPVGGELEKQATNWHAIIMFCLFVAMTMGITYWAAGRTKSASDFYRRRRHHRLPERHGDRG